jgi:sterol desaturase/sphingolipid hydroxylase (fatty acid hydroxylase superfamily)
MSKVIEYSTNKKAIINYNYNYPEGEYIFYIIQASAIEASTSYYIVPHNENPNYLYVAAAFIPMSFAFNIIFDFFFYWAHRILHRAHLPWHKQHHHHIHLKPAITFYQDPVDILLTISIPFVTTTYIIESVYPLSSFEIALLVTYKIFVELSGHSGHISKPASSFPQCFWLPKILNIELYSEDHNLHHTKPDCNFSKQFSLWDKVFGTFQQK